MRGRARLGRRGGGEGGKERCTRPTTGSTTGPTTLFPGGGRGSSMGEADAEVPTAGAVAHWLPLVLKHCSWGDQARARTVCKEWRAELESDYNYGLMAATLAARERLYLPAAVPVPSQRALFFELWQLRGMWDPPAAAAEAQEREDQQPEGAEAGAEEEGDLPAEVRALAERLAGVGKGEGAAEGSFQIQVSARFRPADVRAPKFRSSNVVLPLHQKLQIIKANNGSCSTSEAMRLLAVEGGYADKVSGNDPWKHAAVRTRANNKENKDFAEKVLEKEEQYKTSVLAVKEAEAKVLTVSGGVGLREFAFHRVFGERSKQADVYAQSAQRLVVDFVNGYNCSLFVYGQTGSGKTHTMYGHLQSQVHAGIVPRAVREVIEAVRAREEAVDAQLAVSYIKVYGNEVRDLLRERELVGQSAVAAERYVQDGEREVPVSSLAEVADALITGEGAKRKAATAMNENSSCAHTFFIVTLRQRDRATGAEVKSKLFLVDLGGSEKLTKSKADEGTLAAGADGTTWEEYYAARERLQEALHINAGLFALKKCIDALLQREVAKATPDMPMPYVPYQDSMLTKLLAGALGGNSKTVICVCGSMDPSHGVETLQTLRFGERCSGLKTTAGLASAALVAELEGIEREIAACEAHIEKKERWENKKVKRFDEASGTWETLNTTVPVGAEHYRARLEVLLGKKAELSGRSRALAAA